MDSFLVYALFPYHTIYGLLTETPPAEKVRRLRGSQPTTMTLRGLQGSMSHSFFVYFTKRFGHHPVCQSISDSIGVQFGLEPFASHRPVGQPIDHPPLSIVVVVEIAEVGQTANCLPYLNGRGSFGCEKPFDLSDGPISTGKKPYPELHPITG
jgi:hypothetical protein